MAEYGSDLWSIRGWGERLDALLTDDEPRDGLPWEPSTLDWVIFRPDESARDAMIRYGVKYPEVIGQVREFLDYVECRYLKFDHDESSEDVVINYADSLPELARVILTAADAIEAVESSSEEHIPVPDIPGLAGKPRLLFRFMWNRDSAHISELTPEVWDDEPTPGTVRTTVSRANRKLSSTGTLHVEELQVFWKNRR